MSILPITEEINVLVKSVPQKHIKRLWTCCPAGCEGGWSIFTVQPDDAMDDGYDVDEIVTGGLDRECAERLTRQHNATVVVMR